MVKINGKNETILFAFNSLFSKYNKVPNIIQNDIWKYSNWHWKYYIFLIMRPRTTKFERGVMMKMINDEELFLRYCWPTKGVYFYFQPGPLSEILTIANLRHAASRVWTCAEPEFRLSWMKLCGSDNHFTTLPQVSSYSCVGPFQRSRIFFFILSIYANELISTPKIMTFLSTLPSGNENLNPNWIQYHYQYIPIYLNQHF